MLDIIQRAELPAAVIMAQEGRGVQIVFFHQPRQQRDQGLIGGVREPAVLLQITAFDGNGIVIVLLDRIADLI